MGVLFLAAQDTEYACIEEILEAKRDLFPVEVEVDEGVIAVKLVEVGSFIESFGVGREPTAVFGVVKAAAIEDEGVDFAFGLKTPRDKSCGDGTVVGIEEFFFTEGAIAVRFDGLVGMGINGGDIAGFES